MFIESVKTPGLAHLSYIIGNGGLAAVIDPRRDVEVYINLAKQHGCRITHIIETHRNEDFISGAPYLAQLTAATVFHGPNADGEVRYATTIHEGEQIELGHMTLEVIETPGHTKDSICLLAFDQDFNNGPVGIFTGDTLFVGDVGRTDFYPQEKQRVAGMLFDSLAKIKQRAPNAILYPAHGAGSVCGGGMADREFSTVAHEMSNNPMLQLTDKQQFVAKKCAEHHYYAPYFEHMEKLNLQGGEPYLSPRVIAPIDFDDIPDKSYCVIDVRSVESYLGAHFPNSLSLPVNMITAYAGWILPYGQKIVIVADDEEMASEAAVHFARIGYDGTHYFILANFAAHAAQGGDVESSEVVEAPQVKQLIEQDRWQIVDVRKITEHQQMRIQDSLHIFLGHLNNEADTIDPEQPVITMCASGVRATVASAILKKYGVRNVKVFIGSMGAWKEADFPSFND